MKSVDLKLTDAARFPADATVADRAAVRALTDPKACRILATFIGRERTLSQAAADLDLSLSALTYWVGRLIAAGLLTVARRERRRGSPVKWYRATADAFFVPNAALIEHGRASFRAELQSELQAALTRSLAYADGADAAWGMRFTRHPSGAMSIGEASRDGRPREYLDPAEPATLRLWDLFALDFADAKALQRELTELLERYRGRDGAQAYVVRCALAPLPPGDGPRNRG